MYQKSIYNIIRSFFLSGIIVFLIGCSANIGESSNLEGNTKEDNMKPTSTTKAAFGAVPPIDAAVPPDFETAAFGLG